MNIFAKIPVNVCPWRTIVLTSLLLIMGATTTLAAEFVFSRGAAIPDLGIASYDGYADVRFNNAFPDNGAGADAIFAGDAGNAAINRGLIRWDLSSLAGGTILGDATLTMRVIQLSQDIAFETVDGADFFDFYRIVDTNSGWIENTNGGISAGPAVDLDPSWNNFSQTPLQPWVNAAGTGDFPGLGAAGDGYNSTAAFTLNQATYTAGEDVQITVPQAVIVEIIAGGANHPGFLLRARDEFFAGRIGFSGSASLHSLTIDADIPIQVAELEIDRTTGAMTLMNNTGSAIDFKSYSITSGAGALDPAEWTRVVDPNTWSDLSATTGELSEEENPFVDGKQLASGGGSLSFGNAWIQSPTEDFVMELTLNDDSTQTVAVSFVGNGDEPFALGDLNFMGGVTAADWPLYRDGFGQDLSGLSQAQAYGMGDLNNDGVNDHADFVLFRTAFDADNGAGAFAAMVASVPEPSSSCLMILGSLVALGISRLKRFEFCNLGETTMFRKTFAILCATTMLAAVPMASAVTVQVDFGIDGQTSSGTTGWNDMSGATPGPNPTTPVENLVDSTGAATTIDLAYSESGNNAGVSGAGANWAGPYPAATAGMPTSALQDGFFYQAGVEITLTLSSLDPNSTYDFLLYGARGNNGGDSTYTANGSNSGNGSIADVFENSLETVSISGIVPTAGGVIDLVLSQGDTPAGAGSINMMQFTSTELDQPTLQVNTTTGEVMILNDTTTTFDINFYEITSPGDALLPGTWNSFADQDLEGSGLPNGTGDGWEELGTPNIGKLAEGFLQGSLMLGNGDDEVLGNAFNTSTFGQNVDGDLIFKVGLTDDSLLQGKVVYVTSAGLEGDYNSDGIVNAADYTLWRDNLGAADESGINNNGDGGGVTASDYTFWKSRFGDTAGSGSGSLTTSAVPEPASIAMALLAVCLVGVASRRR